MYGGVATSVAVSERLWRIGWLFQRIWQPDIYSALRPYVLDSQAQERNKRYSPRTDAVLQSPTPSKYSTRLDPLTAAPGKLQDDGGSALDS